MASFMGTSVGLFPVLVLARGPSYSFCVGKVIFIFQNLSEHTKRHMLEEQGPDLGVWILPECSLPGVVQESRLTTTESFTLKQVERQRDLTYKEISCF